MLHAYVDGELDAMSSLEVEKHIQACPQCRQTYRNLSVLKEAVTASAPYFKAPAHLRRSIIAATSKQVASEEPSLAPPWSWCWSNLTAGLAMAACLVLGFFAALQVHQHSARDLLLGELTASHVRSLLATHLMDVASTDQHTVKPWFDGKLDFAPPVKDLAESG
ncbi:MAG: zf-HC2 domain-containing protein, partial [Verrucomicrobiota bacterium]|nr:zf-HC2 domain-containing protein [Verrucomicrobiota bacterium]